MSSYISNLSIHNWGGKSPSGSFSFQFDGGNTTYNLSKEDCEAIFAVAISIIDRKKEEIAKALLAVPSPTLLGYDEKKTIDGEIPF